MLKWQPISEFDPETHKEPVDIWVEDHPGAGTGVRHPNMKYVQGSAGEDNDWCDLHDMYCLADIDKGPGDVTHFAILPPAPEGQDWSGHP